MICIFRDTVKEAKMRVNWPQRDLLTGKSSAAAKLSARQGCALVEKMESHVKTAIAMRVVARIKIRAS